MLLYQFVQRRSAHNSHTRTYCNFCNTFFCTNQSTHNSHTRTYCNGAVSVIMLLEVWSHNSHTRTYCNFGLASMSILLSHNSHTRTYCNSTLLQTRVCNSSNVQLCEPSQLHALFICVSWTNGICVSRFNGSVNLRTITLPSVFVATIFGIPIHTFSV